MKNFMFIVALVVCTCIGYWGGQSAENVSNGNHWAKSKIAKQADGLLAYQHYYECAEELLKDVKIDAKSKIGKDFAEAKKELEDYSNNVIMEWPVICDQRDKLSDAIREFADNHPEFSGHRDHDIMAYVENAGLNPNDLPYWAYAY
ncbi:MAG: hypothetical protein J5548_10770 [Prevotella sp.]|nr:hypothetical protein [Prevotella sp.]